jgi:hypothetical protein
MDIYLVGQRSDLTGETRQWTLNGVFSTKEAAVAACRDWSYFWMGPFGLDVQGPHETYEAPGGYPKLSEAPPTLELDPPEPYQIGAKP